MRPTAATTLVCMKIVTIGVIVGLMASGCVNYRASQGVAIVGGLGLLGTAIAGAVREGPGPDADIDPGGILLGMAVLASATVALSGVIGMAVHSPRRSKPGVTPALALRSDPALAQEARRAREARAREAAARADQERAAANARAQEIRLRVLELMKEAQAAANAQDCAVVKERGISIRALDSELHATMFVGDETIKPCLDTTLAQPAP